MIKETGEEIRTYEIKIKVTRDEVTENELYDFVDPDDPASDPEKTHAGYSFLNFLYGRIKEKISNGSKGAIHWDIVSVKDKT